MSTQFAPIWNNASVDFSCIKANVTDTNSGSNSTLLDLLVGGSSKAGITKAGKIFSDAAANLDWFSGRYAGTEYIRLGYQGSVGYGLFSGSAYSGNTGNGFGIGSTVNIFANTTWGSGTSSATFITFSHANNTSPVIKLERVGYTTKPAILIDQTTGTTSYPFEVQLNSVRKHAVASSGNVEIYNAFTNDSNYERGKLEWSSNVFRIGTEKAGTGSARALELQTDGTTRLTIDTSGYVYAASGKIGVGSSGGAFLETTSQTSNVRIGFNSSARLQIDTANITILDPDISKIRFGSTSSFPAIKRNGTAINFRLADDSADAPITASQATLSTGTITASTPAVDISQTWNNAGVTFTGAKLNITDTASNASSLLMDLQVGGSSKFAVTKDGAITGGNVIIGITGGIYLKAPSSYIMQHGTVAISDNGSWRNFLLSPSTTGTSQFLMPGGGILGWSDSNGNAATTTDLIIRRDTANTLAQRNDANAQTFRLYGTYANSGVDYRRLSISSTTAGAFTINAEGAGTGASGNTLELQTGGTTALSLDASGNVTIPKYGASYPSFKMMANSSTAGLSISTGSSGEVSLSSHSNLSLAANYGNFSLYAGYGTRLQIGDVIRFTLDAGVNIRNSANTADAPITASRATLSATLDLTIRTVTYGATMAIDAALGNKIAITLTGNGTISNPTNAVDGRVLVFRLRQDGSGNRVPVWDTKYAFVGDLATVTLSTAASAIDRIAFEYDSTDDKWYCISFIKGS